MKKTFIIFSFMIIVALFFVTPVTATAAISTIAPGNTVFIGEQGLDVTSVMNGDSQIAWWASGAAIATSSPDYIVSISNQTNFYVSPTDFGSHQGSWYRFSASSKANGTAFIVMDPQLDIRVEDSTVNVDVTDKWVPSGDDLKFIIETNLVQIMQRIGVNSIPVTVYVQSPTGGTFNALLDSTGNANPIVDIPVTTNPFSPSFSWNTGKRDIYPPGTYYIWAECDVNSMKDNYGQLGKTISQQVSLLNQDQNPLIANSGYVTNPTTQIAVVAPQITTAIATPAVTSSPTTQYATSVQTVIPIAPPVTTTLAIPPANIPIQAKSSGFEAGLVAASMFFAIVLLFRKQ
jgi:hypothetical protein